jgi:hypothetical protein
MGSRLAVRVPPSNPARENMAVTGLPCRFRVRSLSGGGQVAPSDGDALLHLRRHTRQRAMTAESVARSYSMKFRRVGKGALAPCPPHSVNWWARCALPTLRILRVWCGDRMITSLRATGSRECAPDDRLREAIHRPGRHCERSEAIHRATVRKNGLLRCARNDGLRAMAQHGTPHSQSSSPANGSRECALDDRRRDAIHCPGRHCERSEAIHLTA